MKAFVEGKPMTTAWDKYRTEIKDSCMALWKIWVPAQAINFAFVPRHMRIPFVAAVSFGWTVVLSVMQGKFDAARLESAAQEKEGGGGGGALLETAAGGAVPVAASPAPGNGGGASTLASAAAPARGLKEVAGKEGPPPSGRIVAASAWEGGADGYGGFAAALATAAMGRA